MSHLDRDTFGFGLRHELLCLIEGGCHRFFDQHRDPGIDEIFRDIEVVLGRDSNRCNIEIAQYVVIGFVPGCLAFPGHLFATLLFKVHYTDQIDIVHGCVDARMMLAKMSGAYDRCPQWGHETSSVADLRILAG